MAREGKRTASIERKYVGGACMNIACMPSKNIIHTAKVASLIGRHQEFGIETGPIVVNMAGVYARKRKMVEDLMKMQLDQYQTSGAELIGKCSIHRTAYSPGRSARRRRTDSYG
jgi:Pyruvate/2-oxoglutarate dehydrogenase complex, dihydrolipoamide dehydrogenase (E3) component, and related enzymes